MSKDRLMKVVLPDGTTYRFERYDDEGGERKAIRVVKNNYTLAYCDGKIYRDHQKALLEPTLLLVYGEINRVIEKWLEELKTK